MSLYLHFCPAVKANEVKQNSLFLLDKTDVDNTFTLGTHFGVETGGKSTIKHCNCQQIIILWWYGIVS